MFKALLLIGIILLGLYLVMFPETITNLTNDGKIEVNIGTSSTWTNENFSTVAENPTDYTGDHVKLNGFFFNKINITDNNEVIGFEVFLGSKNELLNNPMDTNRRILVVVPKSLEGNLQTESCIFIDGTIKGVAKVTMIDGTIINPIYIESNKVTETTCNK